MTWWIPIAAGAPLLLLLFVAGIPAFVCFLILNLIGLLALTGTAGFGMFANSIFTTATNGTLAAVPLFILMGEIMFRSGAMKTLFDALDRLVGQIRGRQFVLCILLSAILGALSGAAMAVAGLLGRSLFPTMVQRGYDRRLSAGTIMAGACLDPIIPPSVLAVIIATIANVSPASMLVAGILPGLLLMGMFLIYVVGRVWLDPSLAPDSQVDIADRNKEGTKTAAVLRMVPCVFVFFMVMGLIMLGVATPTEAAATGVFGALVVSIYYGGLSKQMIWESAESAATITCLLLVIMCSAVMFSQLLTYTGAAQKLGELVAALALPAPLMLFALIALPFVLEMMFLDAIAIMLVLIPIYQPLLKLYGFHEIWFWTLFLVITVVGGLTPPFGYVLFAMKSAAPEVPTTEIFSASWPFVWIIVLGLVFMALFPPIITFLPDLTAPR
jgi:tripartite ATP-independent transporter DctM subunit